MRVGKENDWKSGQIYLFFRRHLPPECLKDVRRCLRKERIGPILRKVRDNEAANPSTTLSTNQALYVLYRNFPGLLPEFQADLNMLNNFNAVTKKKADSYIAEKRKYTIKYGFTDIKKCLKIRSDARASSSSTFPCTRSSRVERIWENSSSTRQI